MNNGIIVLLSSFVIVHTFGRECCPQLKGKSCQDACMQITHESSPARRLKRLIKANDRCNAEIVELWRCINNTVPELTNSHSWSGTFCCEKAKSASCQNSCGQADSTAELRGICHQSDELHLFQCVERQQLGDHCCNQGTTLGCRAMCRHVYLNDQTNTLRQALLDQCQDSSPAVPRCVYNRSRTQTNNNNPSNSIECCESAPSHTCKTTCQRVLRASLPEKEIVDELIISCGNPHPTKPMWKCFFLKEYEDPDPPAYDSAKLQCCAKAVTPTCRNLCNRMYSRSWDTWDQLESQCLSFQELSPHEVVLQSCLIDVDEPCQLGCSGLEYCSYFNHRPTEMFRSCSADADTAAKHNVQSWSNGYINLPQMSIRVKDIHHCEPEMWKAVACAIQIKPCRTQTGSVTICRDDCLYLLGKCVDPDDLPAGTSVEKLCKILSPSKQQDSCVSIRQYLGESALKTRHTEITAPCISDPCSDTEVCLLNRRKCKHGKTCQPYVCRPGCSLGEVSTFLVPYGSYVRLPIVDQHAVCHKVCKCTHHRGLSDHCTAIPCEKPQSCLLGDHQLVEHGAYFHLDCNQCVCHSGQVICSKRQCWSADAAEKDTQTGLPCNCDANYSPVCASNGKTYPNKCIAICAGFYEDQYIQGSCSSYDPCSSQPCGLGHQCISRQQVCLSGNIHTCQQYECVSQIGLCNHHHHDPVCDTTDEEFTNICLLLDHQRQLAYRGHCRHHCSVDSGVVCGHNGETYTSECAAWSDGATLDYYGHCRKVAISRDNVISVASLCDDVMCKPVQPSNCQGIIPPGGCCPVCAAELRVIFSQKIIDEIVNSLRIGPLSLTNVSSLISSLITISECHTFVYLSIENEIVILVMAISENPTILQVDTCTREAERLQLLLNSASPMMMSYVALTPLLAANLRMSRITYTALPQNSTCATLRTNHGVLGLGLLLGLLLHSINVAKR